MAPPSCSGRARRRNDFTAVVAGPDRMAGASITAGPACAGAAGDRTAGVAQLGTGVRSACATHASADDERAATLSAPRPAARLLRGLGEGRRRGRTARAEKSEPSTGGGSDGDVGPWKGCRFRGASCSSGWWRALPVNRRRGARSPRSSASACVRRRGAEVQGVCSSVPTSAPEAGPLGCGGWADCLLVAGLVLPDDPECG
jgi:hypothetical protein